MYVVAHDVTFTQVCLSVAAIEGGGTVEHVQILRRETVLSIVIHTRHVMLSLKISSPYSLFTAHLQQPAIYNLCFFQEYNGSRKEGRRGYVGQDCLYLRFRTQP
jgi:hypothetical protein